MTCIYDEGSARFYVHSGWICVSGNERLSVLKGDLCLQKESVYVLKSDKTMNDRRRC